MMTFLQTALVQGVLVHALLLPGIAGLVDTGDLESLQETYENVREQRRRAADRMEKVESTYRKLVAKISRRKRDGENPSENEDLKKLIRRARNLSDKLQERRKRLRNLDGRLEKLRNAIIAEVEKLEGRIEEKLDEVSDEKRKKLVRQLNRLRSVHQRHHVPLPDAPDPNAISKTLRMAERTSSSDPEQMATAADALEDSEQQVRERLRAVRKKLKSLRRTRALVRRAETFRERRKLFDEDQRPRAVARSRSTGDEGASSNSDSNASGPGDRSSDGSEPSSDPTNSDERAAGPPPKSRFDDDRRSGDREETPKTSASDDSSGSSPEQPFNSEDSMVVEPDADPSANVSDASLGPDELSRRIGELEKERKQLQDQAKRLEKKARELRSRADKLKSSE